MRMALMKINIEKVEGDTEDASAGNVRGERHTNRRRERDREMS